SFAAEVVSPGFANRVVREAQALLQEPCRGSTAIPCWKDTSELESFLIMPDIRSVASVLEPTSSSNECVRDPTSVQAVVAALQQAQVGKGIKRGSCYMEPEDLSKRQKCTATGGSIVSTSIPINYSRDYLEDGHSCGSNGGGGEKRALDLSPSAQGSSQQLSPDNKKRCVLDPMVASFSSSKHIVHLGIIQANGRDTPFSMYDSRRDTDSESNPSVESGQSKHSEQSLHQQTSEATGGESCIISPGPSERDPSDRSGSHTPQSIRGESCGGGGGTANTSRTSTPRNPTPPRPTHVISLEAYKAEKAKSQQRLKKMLGMLFHVKEGEELQQSKSGDSTPVSGSAFTLVSPASTTTSVTPSLTPATTSGTIETTATSLSTSAVGGLGTLLSSNSIPKVKISEENATSSTGSITQTPSEGAKSEVTASFTLFLKPPSTSASTSTASTVSDSGNKEKDKATAGSDVSVTEVFKLPADAKVNNGGAVVSLSTVNKSSAAPLSSGSLVEFLKTTSPAKSGILSTPSSNENPLLKTYAHPICTSGTETSHALGILPVNTSFMTGSTGKSTLAQSSPISTNVISSTPAFSANMFHNVSTSSIPFNATLTPPRDSTINNSSVSPEYIPSPSAATSFTFRSSNLNKCVSSPQSSSGPTSSVSVSSSTRYVMSSGFYSNTSPSVQSSTASQGLRDALTRTSDAGLASILSNYSSDMISFGIGSNGASTQSPFTFLDPKKSKASTDSTSVLPSRSHEFSFKTSQDSSSPATLFASTGTSQASSSIPSTGFDSFGSQIGSTASPVTSPPVYSVTSSSVTAPTPFGVSTTSAAAPFGVSTTSAAAPFGASTTSATAPFGMGTTSAAAPFGMGTTSAAAPFGVSATSVTAPFGVSTTSATAPSPFGVTPSSAAPSPFGVTSSAAAPSPFGVTSSAAAPSPFGVTPSLAAAPSPFGVTSSSATAPFGVSSTSVTTPSLFGGVSVTPVVVQPIFGVSTASITSPSTFNSTTASVTSTNQTSSFSFGQSAGSQPTTTASASPFTFGSSSTQATSGPSSSVFQFGGPAAPTGTVTLPQPFAPAVVSTQTSTVTSPLFSFGTAGAPPPTTTAAAATPSPFTFGAPKSNTPGQTFGSTTETSGKAVSSGFSFNPVPAASTTTSPPSAGFSFGPPATTQASGFQFSSPRTAPSTNMKANSSFNFGSNTNKAPSFGGASSATSPFSFGGSTATATNFGSNPSQSFGATTTGTPTFGTSTPSFATATVNPTSPFGSTNAFGATSPNASFTAPTFGTPNGNKTNSGANPFGVQGATASFAAGNNPAQTPTFGSTGSTSVFGATQTPSFGSTTFGSDKTATNKGSTFQFGQGASNTPSFGAASPPTFGGATSPSTFGGVSATGAAGGPVFQFGSTNAPSFSAGNGPASVATRRPRARAPRRHR
ncbi:Nuclear pore complex protein NUP98A-like, partial [Homarus americanus]